MVQGGSLIPKDLISRRYLGRLHPNAGGFVVDGKHPAVGRLRRGAVNFRHKRAGLALFRLVGNQSLRLGGVQHILNRDRVARNLHLHSLAWLERIAFIIVWGNEQADLYCFLAGGGRRRRRLC